MQGNVPGAVLQKIVAILSQTEIHPMPFMILMELMKDLRSEASYRPCSNQCIE